MGNHTCDCLSSLKPTSSITQNKLPLSQSRIALENGHVSDSEKRTVISIDEYQPKRFIQSDYYGAVILIKKKHCNDNRLMALKIIEKQKLKEKIFLNHLKKDPLRKINFLIQIFNIYENPHKVFVVMENIDPGNLLYYLKKEKSFNQNVIKHVASQVLQALKFLHKQKLVFGNLKPQSVVVSQDGHIKLTDYWLSTECQYKQSAYRYSGVIQYTAPEILNNAGYNQTIDIWTFGIFLYQMKHGVTPFAIYDEEHLIRNCILQGLFPINEDCTDQFRDLIRKLICLDPNHRLTIQNIESHPFFNGVNCETMSHEQYLHPLKDIVKKFNTKSHHANYQKPKRIQLTQDSIYPIINERPPS